ncbi:helix-turn-helix domain-containing protein [Halobacillus litoralis]|uniref:helix-turn-helix domain-containing protein n=1 Tax=Halobacillus litoralis TaxID=45668 RepID=UPI001CD2B91E|nr:helix-turn-helix domain-containing protein [Halobacillus litoralis]MCA1021534.1 helix-turn-helix domain-containing protein [Halobacillus litoralis]
MNLRKLRHELSGEISLSSVIGALIFGIRIDADLTQKGLSKLANVDIEVIHRLEGGSGVDTMDLDKVLKALDVSKKELGYSIAQYMENYERQVK